MGLNLKFHPVTTLTLYQTIEILSFDLTLLSCHLEVFQHSSLLLIWSHLTTCQWHLLSFSYTTYPMKRLKITFRIPLLNKNILQNWFFFLAIYVYAQHTQLLIMLYIFFPSQFQKLDCFLPIHVEICEVFYFSS